MRQAHLEEANRVLRTQRYALLEKLETFIGNNERKEELTKGVDMLLHRVGPSCEERKIVTDYYFSRFSKLLLPSYSKFLLWMMNQGDDFFSIAGSGSPASNHESALWGVFVKELNLSADQEEKLSMQYKAQESSSFRSERRKLSITVTYLEKLRQAMEKRANAVQQHAESLFQILTPDQVDKSYIFLIYMYIYIY